MGGPRTPGAVRSVPGPIDRDTVDVLREHGYDPDGIARLIDDGVVIAS